MMLKPFTAPDDLDRVVLSLGPSVLNAFIAETARSLDAVELERLIRLRVFDPGPSSANGEATAAIERLRQRALALVEVTARLDERASADGKRFSFSVDASARQKELLGAALLQIVDGSQQPQFKGPEFSLLRHECAFLALCVACYADLGEIAARIVSADPEAARRTMTAASLPASLQQRVIFGDGAPSLRSILVRPLYLAMTCQSRDCIDALLPHSGRGVLPVLIENESTERDLLDFFRRVGIGCEPEVFSPLVRRLVQNHSHNSRALATIAEKALLFIGRDKAFGNAHLYVGTMIDAGVYDQQPVESVRAALREGRCDLLDRFSETMPWSELLADDPNAGDPSGIRFFGGPEHADTLSRLFELAVRDDVQGRLIPELLTPQGEIKRKNITFLAREGSLPPLAQLVSMGVDVRTRIEGGADTLISSCEDESPGLAEALRSLAARRTAVLLIQASEQSMHALTDQKP